MGWGGDGKEAQEPQEDICILTTDSCCCKQKPTQHCKANLPIKNKLKKKRLLSMNQVEDSQSTPNLPAPLWAKLLGQ